MSAHDFRQGDLPFHAEKQAAPETHRDEQMRFQSLIDEATQALERDSDLGGHEERRIILAACQQAIGFLRPLLPQHHVVFPLLEEAKKHGTMGAFYEALHAAAQALRTKQLKR